MTARWVIGLASGASADGLDAALVEIEDSGLSLRPRYVYGLHQPLAQDVRQMLQRVTAGTCETREASSLHRLLGETFAVAARQVADGASLNLQKVHCIGCLGHTVWGDSEARFPSHLTLGMPAVVAERTGVTTLSDFRGRDMAAGGQGVPLGALADFILLRNYHPAQGKILIHLGTTSQIVYLPANCRIQEILGFEAGPCNLLLDGLIHRLTGGQESFDNGGKYAVQGRCLETLVERWQSHPFFARRPPRAIPRHVFGEAFALEAIRQAQEKHWNPYDLLCTATHFVARMIVEGVRRFLPGGAIGLSRILLSGGGTRNGLLRRLLEHQLSDAQVLELIDAAGVPWHSRKAVAAALLAALTLDGVPANLCQTTGASGSRLLGSFTPGSSANWARCLVWMASQTTVSGQLV
jgi:anhydro-N-acetylmuramic acid kinase